MRISLVLIAALTIILLVAGCADKPVTSPASTMPPRVSAPVDFGHGVCYFGCVKSEFGASLASYLGNHPELEVSAIAADPMTSSYNSLSGYFVTFRKK